MIKNVVLLCKKILLSTKQNEIIKSEGKWTELEKTILNKVSQTPKDKYYIFSVM